MFPVKYVAKNELTGISIRTFRTLRGAKRWYKKPIRLMGLKILKQDMFINIYKISYKESN
jgi:hypothetical protein